MHKFNTFLLLHAAHSLDLNAIIDMFISYTLEGVSSISAL